MTHLSIVSRTVEIDKRLGQIQYLFKLNGFEMRIVASKSPKLITTNINIVKVINQYFRKIKYDYLLHVKYISIF